MQIHQYGSWWEGVMGGETIIPRLVTPQRGRRIRDCAAALLNGSTFDIAAMQDRCVEAVATLEASGRSLEHKDNMQLIYTILLCAQLRNVSDSEGLSRMRHRHKGAHTQTDTCADTHTHTHTRVRTHALTRARAHARTHTHTRTHPLTHKHSRASHTHTHTHTLMRIPATSGRRRSHPRTHQHTHTHARARTHAV